MKKSNIYTFLVLFVASCGASKISNSTRTTDDNYKVIAAGILGENVNYTMNDTETYVLCVSEVKGTPEQPRNTLSYVVIKMKDNSTTLENKIEGGTAMWSGNLVIEIFRTPGIMRNDQSHDDFVTLYNVETGKSYPKKNIEQH